MKYIDCSDDYKLYYYFSEDIKDIKCALNEVPETKCEITFTNTTDVITLKAINRCEPRHPLYLTAVMTSTPDGEEVYFFHIEFFGISWNGFIERSILPSTIKTIVDKFASEDDEDGFFIDDTCEFLADIEHQIGLDWNLL